MATSSVTSIQAPPAIKLEQIGPQQASQYLGTSAGNRNIKKRAVSRYARDMVTGKWVQNGESIKFDRAGHLIDGHHRLHAILEAKVTLPILVIRGIQEGAMLTLDTGVARSFMDAQAVAGQATATHLAPILRWWYRYEVTHMNLGIVPTFQELEEILEAHPHIVESARCMSRLKLVRARCIPGVQGFVHAYTCYKYDRELADEFMQELNDGAGLAKTSPIYLLRSRLIDTPSRVRLDAVLVCALTIKAWNAWINKGTLGALRWSTQGDSPEPFPVFSIDEKRFAVARALQTERVHAQRTAALDRGRKKMVHGDKGHFMLPPSGGKE